jgi:hypothetical protein
MNFIPDFKTYLSEERSGRDILQRSLVTSSGAMLISSTEFSYVAGARDSL